MITIRLARPGDAEPVAAQYRELLEKEAREGTKSNWKLDVYPTIRVPEEKIPAREMYVLETGGRVLGSMVVNEDQAPEYGEIDWAYPAGKGEVLVIHTLCIPPSEAGRGYGSLMVRFAQDMAREQGKRGIRLDTWAHNEPAKALYAKHGFRIAGYGNIVLQGLIPEEQVYLEWKA